MSQKRNLWIAIAAILLIIAAGAGGYYMGKTSAEKQAVNAARAEQELNVMLNRSDLDGLGEIKGPIYVTGHQSPDSDTVCSAIAYAALLQELGYDAHPAVLGKINKETEYILNAAGLEPPELLEDASGCNMILVDHSEYTQSAEGLKDANIITIIDHHGDGAVTTGNQLIYDARPLGSTATIVWMRYRNYGVDLDPNVATAMLGAVLSDTINLKSNTTTAADEEAVKVLSEIAGISDVETFYKEMYKESISYEGMSDEEILFSDLKVYEAGGKRFIIGCINVYDEEEAKDMSERMKKLLPMAVKKTGTDIGYAQISIFHDDISVGYFVPSDDVAMETFETAFPEAAFDGTAYRIEPGFSRKTVFVPAITNVLEGHPKE